MMHLAPWEAARRVKARLIPAEVWLVGSRDERGVVVGWVRV